MRVLMTSFAALLALVAFGPGVTGAAQGADTGTNGGCGRSPGITASAGASLRADISSSTSASFRFDIRSRTFACPCSDICSRTSRTGAG